jgi:hypothetical protein
MLGKVSNVRARAAKPQILLYKWQQAGGRAGDEEVQADQTVGSLRAAHYVP